MGGAQRFRVVVLSRIALLLLLSSLFAARAWAVDSTWTFNGDGLWTDAANWSGGEPVDDTFDVFIDDGDTAVSVTLSGLNRTIGSLSLGADDTLVIENNTVAVPRGLTSAIGFTNDGSILLTGTSTAGTFLTLTTGTLTNSMTGLLHFQAGGGSRTFTGDLVNNGTVQIDRATTFNKAGGSYANHGQFTVNQPLTISGGGGTFEQAGGTLSLNGTLNLSGSSALNLTGGTLDMKASLNLGGNLFTQDSGVLNYTSGTISGGTYRYLGGTITGVPQLTSATLEIGPAATDPVSFLLVNSNTLASDVHAGQTLTVQNASVSGTHGLTLANGFTNAGSMLVTGNSSATTFLTLTTGTLTNEATGLLHFQTGGGSRTFTGDLVNNGTVQIDRTTTFNKAGGSYANHGQFTVNQPLTISNGGTFEQTSGTLDLNGTLTITGSSALNLTGGTMELNGGTLSLGGNIFTQDGGILDYTSGSISGGTYRYLGGTITGVPQLTSATLEIGPAATDPVSFLLVNSNTLASDVHAGQTLTVQNASVSGTHGLTSANGFTNAGSMLVTSNSSATTFLTLTTGTLTNSVTGLLHFQTGGGSRTFTGDLVNNGTVQIDRTTTFNKAGAQYTNNGQLIVSASQTLTFNNGTLTNFAASALTGGTYDVSGTFRFPGADIVTNNAEIILRGASSQILNQTNSANALGNLATIGPAGALRLFSGRNFTAAGAFTNEGEMELGGTTFDAPSLTNAATGEILGYGMIPVRPTNSGIIRAVGGTLTFGAGIQGGSGTVQIDPGATLDLSGGGSDSSADNLIHNGAELILGANDFLVAADYNNANFGVGNAFDRRANVNGTGQILASPGVTQSLSGDVTGGNAATATMDFGNVHVGTAPTRTYQIANSGASGPILRGAIQTSAGGGNLTDARLIGSGVTASNYGPVSLGGASEDLSVTFDATVAGPIVGQQVGIINNFDNVDAQVLQISGVAYRLADPTPHTPEPVILPTVHVGEVVDQVLTVTNAAVDEGYSESLDASFTDTTGAATASGSFNALPAESTDSTSLVVGIDTLTAGVKTGTATIQFTSNGAGISGLGLTALANQVVNVQGQVNHFAEAAIEKISGDGEFSQTGTETYQIDFGKVAVDAVHPIAELGVTNVAPSPADELAGSWDASAADFLLNGLSPFSGVDAGDTLPGMMIELDTSTVGSKSGLLTLMPRGENDSGFSGALSNIVITLLAEVILPGDYNGDGMVNAADYTLWRDHLGAAGGTLPNDLSDDLIGPTQYAHWFANFGGDLASGSQSGGAVPEPATAILLCLGCLGLFWQCGRRAT